MFKIPLQEKQYVLSISFANYLKGVSGMAKVLMEHQLMYNNQGIGYVNLFVVKKYLFREKVTAFCFYGLVINGEYKGIYQIEQIINILSAWNRENKILLDIHFHHFLYIKMKQMDKLIKHIPEVPLKVYLHDYYTVCWNYTLRKNGGLYCGPTGIHSEKCVDCMFYERSKKRMEQITDFLYKYKERITIISPSEATKTIWLETYPEFVNQIDVVWHQYEKGEYLGNLEPLEPKQNLKVAFLGMPAEHKGWDVWEKIVAKFHTKGYDFFVFNSSDDTYENMKKVKVQYSNEDLDAMTNALRKEKIHIVLLWAKWPETYSYTLYESMAANLYVITNKISGNITEQVSSQSIGLVLEKQEELFSIFNDIVGLREKINMFRREGKRGPLNLEKNDKIVKLTRRITRANSVIKRCWYTKLYNYPLVYVLRVLYTHNKIPG